MRHLPLRGTRALAGVMLGGLALGACNDRDPVAVELATGMLAKAPSGGHTVGLQNYSVTPALVKGLPEGVSAFSIISSDDDLAGTPAFRFGGSADGTGLLRNADGTYTMLVNHEDNFSVSRIRLDKDFRPLGGEYIVNSTAGRFRLCSATLATPEEHGFGPVFITAGESSQESQIHAVNPFGSANSSRLLTAFGRWNTENAVPLPKSAFPGRTVVLIGDDDSGPQGGQVAMYVSNEVGNLDGGRVFVMAREDGSFPERAMAVGQQYRVVFKEIPAIASKTGAAINLESAALGAIQFGRVEDLDYRKKFGEAGREIYFNVTGQNNTGANADYSRTKYGRVYKLVLDESEPTRGTLEVVLDGDDRTGPARLFQNPDNILVTERYAYIQEDPNGYGDETHDSYVYQYDLKKGTLEVVMELDHRRGETYYNGASGTSAFGAWEYGAMLDVSDLLGRHGNDATFLIAVQPHTWRGPKYRNPDGGTLRPSEDQASQMIVVTGLPR